MKLNISIAQCVNMKGDIIDSIILRMIMIRKKIIINNNNNNNNNNTNEYNKIQINLKSK